MLSIDKHSGIKDNINPDDEVYDPFDYYLGNTSHTNGSETEEYFPQENSKPPHY